MIDYMEDSLNYMNAVSEASQALNQVTALKDQALMQFEQKKQEVGGEFQLGGEIGLTSAGSYLGKKALGFISGQVKEGATQLASKVGISEETVGKALSGDISGAVEQGTTELTTAGEGLVSTLGSEASTGILGRVSSGLDNITIPDIPSINPDPIGDIYSQGLEDLKGQMGIDDASFRDFSNISLNDVKPFSYNNITGSGAGGDVEMTNFASPIETGEAAAGDVATDVATTVGEGVATAVGEGVTAVGESVVGEGVAAVGESVVGAAVGEGVLSAVLGPIGAFVGIGLGIWSFFHGEHEDEEKQAPPVFVPALNPSAQFGA